LPFSRREGDAILALVSPTDAFHAYDFDATREVATGTVLSHYRYVHFASHACVSSEHPELSALVLSLVNNRGNSQDGFLRLHDVYNLHLNADMVVLSACETGLGADVSGEGLVGLTRGFMYAGAGHVVVSLWRIDDEATSELMKSFYQQMLVHHLRPAAALRAAQIAIWKQPRWRAPYYWGAFAIQGDWR
jgi:CHAT domain-containing protein